MAEIEIRPVSLPGGAKEFVKAWWPIYADDPMWVPPLVFERKVFFNPAKNPYFKHAEVQLFMAWRDGRPVGTISAHIDAGYQQHQPGVGFFGFFEFKDDMDVSRALLDAACAWLTERGMRQAIGPFNFNSNHTYSFFIKRIKKTTTWSKPSIGPSNMVQLKSK